MAMIRIDSGILGTEKQENLVVGLESSTEIFALQTTTKLDNKTKPVTLA